MLSGQSVLLSVTTTTRVSYVRKRAQQEFGISTVSLRGEVLDSEGTLEGAGVQANDTLYVTVQRCRIFSNQHAGAFACLKADGTVETWGDMDRGGDSNTCSAQPQLQYVQDISASSQAFAAITNSGKVVTWGHHMWGGDSKKVRRQLVGVRKIAAASAAFAALRKDATVVTWGLPYSGGNSTAVQSQLVCRSDNCRKVCICSSLQR